MGFGTNPISELIEFPAVVGRLRVQPAAQPCGAVFFFFFHLVKNMFDFPLLVLKGIYHYWKYFNLSGGLKEMEVFFFFIGVTHALSLVDPGV